MMKTGNLKLWLALFVFPLSCIGGGLLYSWVSVYIFHDYDPKWGPDYQFGLTWMILGFMGLWATAAYLAVSVVFLAKLRQVSPLRIAGIGFVSAILSLGGSMLLGQWIGEWFLIGYPLMAATFSGAMYSYATRNITVVEKTITSLNLENGSAHKNA